MSTEKTVNKADITNANAEAGEVHVIPFEEAGVDQQAASKYKALGLLATHHVDFDPNSPEAKRVLRKIGMRIIPLVFVVYLLQLIDKNSLSFLGGREIKWAMFLSGILTYPAEVISLLLVYGSLAIPAHVAQLCLTPGSIAPEAAAVMVPVLVAMGERDVIADPKGERRAHESASSIDLFIFPRMGHTHNFASTRELFWRRLEIWTEWVRVSRSYRVET